MSLSLVVLAAGMGSRYGGLKQIDPVGPGGETVLDYAVYDALRAGFTRVVFVIRRDFEMLFRDKIGARYAGRAAVDYVFQSLEALPAGMAPPAGREKPWGTGHAVWCAREVIAENFAVINADDFYGADSFAQLARFLGSEAVGGALCTDLTDAGSSGRKAPPTVRAAQSQFAMVGFRLANTLSEHGVVSRGVSTTGPNHELRSIVERIGIAPTDVGPGRTYSGEEIVSMNCWGFTPALFPGLDTQFREFLATSGCGVPSPRDSGRGEGTPPPTGASKSEFYLPAAVSSMIDRGEARVRVLPTVSTWFGVTYRDDKPRVQAAIAGLVQAGLYPEKLWA